MTDAAGDRELPDFFTEAEVHEDVPAYMHELRGRCPVYREPHHDVVMVTGYAQAVDVLSNKREDFSSCLTVTGPIPPLPFTPEGDDISAQLARHRDALPWSEHLVSHDGASHIAQRTLLTQLLTHRRLRQNEDYLLGLSDRLIDRFIDRGSCEITKDYAHAMSTLVICDLLGVPHEDRDMLVETLGAPPTQLGEEDFKVETNPHGFLHPLFKTYLEERIAHPRDDMMSELVHSHYRDGSKPDIDTLVRLATFLFGAGQDTSARLVSFSFKLLGESPALQARLRADPGSIPDFIEEALRAESPVQALSRLAVRSTSLAGVPIPAGSIVTVCLGGANRDPLRFADPDRVDIDRSGLRDQIAFSRGAHACPGAPLARMEARVTLERFLSRTRQIRISEAHHGPPGARRFSHEPTYLLHGLTELHIEFDRA